MAAMEGIRRGRLSREEIGEIIALAQRGFSPGRIAQRLNRHPVTISHAHHRLGLLDNGVRRKITPRNYVRNGVEVRAFSPDEDAFIEQMRLAGAGPSAIAREVCRRFGHPRAPATISLRLVMLANLAEAA